MRIIVDPNTDASGFGYTVEGQYDLRVASCEQRQKEGSAFPYLAWEFEFADPNVQTHDGKGKVGHIFENTTLKTGENSQFALRRVCDALGLAWGDFDTTETVGMEFQAQVKLGKNLKDEIRNEVAKYISKV